jgi:hypothetical protein
VLEIILMIASGTFIFTVGTTIILLVRRRMKYAELHEDWEDAFGPHRFSYKDFMMLQKDFIIRMYLAIGDLGRCTKVCFQSLNWRFL